MGREVRRVPANWQHPITEDNYGRKRKQPMHDVAYEAACAEWLADFDRIRGGGADKWEIECYPNGVCEWAAENTAPKPAYYRPWKDEDATWFQVWETVSEGTPVTPPFATKAELIQYLAENGDEWDQQRCMEPDWARLWGGVPGVSAWGIERARRFVNAEWSPTFVIQDGKVLDGTASSDA